MNCLDPASVKEYKVIKSFIKPVNTRGDIIKVRESGRTLAKEAGFSCNDQTFIATAISEIARNIIEFANKGEIEIGLVNNNQKHGILITSRDEGPGISDIKLAMMDGYSTGNGMGIGLPGAKRMMDEFELLSQVDVGTTVMMVKWKNGIYEKQASYK